MSSTDTRSGFRLPWSSDRSHDALGESEPGDDVTEVVAEPVASHLAWPDSDDNAFLGVTLAKQRLPKPAPEAPEATEAPEAPAAAAPARAEVPTEDPAPVASDAQEPAMIAIAPPTPAPVAPRKPSKLMVDLSAAIRATADSAREQALTQVDEDVAAVVAGIRAGSKEGEVALKLRSDEDVAGIREWSKTEIARIKEEADGRIEARKAALAEEIDAHMAGIEARVGAVEGLAATYRAEMAAYTDRLVTEDDPARLATMAETMPEPPALSGVVEADVADLPSDKAEAVDAIEAPIADTTSPWGSPTPWAAGDELVSGTAGAVGTAGDDTARWEAGETPEGFPAGDEFGDPVDRGAIMAALEAAAEAVVAAEAAAESADQAEAAADVAETAAELLVGRAGSEEDFDPEAQAAFSARVDAGGFDTESFTDRLASLMPNHAEGVDNGEPRTTHVVVSGLVSVASIASFKRHLGRLPGVTAVAVASGPEGEFVFDVSHGTDVSFRDAIQSMPGFAARVTSTGDGVVVVSARDPETEG